ncbi:MAG: hypothetical protein D3908_13320 [Candidatus Electrothrix sp. AUS4]|nr:hypothetical protein [Candidatus Electrothrix sp. AUS4]
MGTIKDLVDLTSQLANSVNDRKIASELNNIQTLLLQFQSEQAELHEKNIQLREEILSKKRTIEKLKNQLKKQINSEEDMVYEDPYYFRKSKTGAKDGPYCQKCFDSKKKFIRLQSPNKNGNWICKECESNYQDGSYDPSKDSFIPIPVGHRRCDDIF